MPGPEEPSVSSTPRQCGRRNLHTEADAGGRKCCENTDVSGHLKLSAILFSMLFLTGRTVLIRKHARRGMTLKFTFPVAGGTGQRGVGVGPQGPCSAKPAGQRP